MKFGQSLEDHLVPEWRVQYLDYKSGKKRLKKLSKKESVLNSVKTTPLLNHSNASRSLRSSRATIASPTTLNTPTAHQLTSVYEEDLGDGVRHLQYQDHPSRNPFKDRCCSLDEEEFFQLPQAAINVEEQEYGSIPGATEFDTVNAFVDEDKQNQAQTPLLNVVYPKTRTVSNNLSGSKKNATSPAVDGPVLGSAPVNSSFSRRKSSIGRLVDNLKRTASVSHNNQETELEDLSTYARKQFIDWVDSELEKVESFYRDRENACAERFLVLRDQIYQLENQKQESKKKWLYAKRMLNSNSHGSGNNAGNGNGTFTGTGTVTGAGDDDLDEDDEADLDEIDGDYDDDDNGYEEYMYSDLVTKYNDNVFGIAQKNIKLLSFWTKRKLRIINKFDMPSFPTFGWLKKDGKVEKQYYEEGYYSDNDLEEDRGSVGLRDGKTSSTAHIRDFQRKKSVVSHNIPYFVARRMIKKSVHELYRSMELLKSYRVMNRIAFRKLIKKYDKSTKDSILNSYMKKVDSNYFSKSEVLDNLMTNLEEVYTRYFENGNRKVAVTKLRTNAIEKTYYLADYFSGFFFGLAIPFVIYAMYLGFHKNHIGLLTNGKYLLQIWGGFFALTLMALLFFINCLVWTKFKVNYKFIFEFNQHDALDFREYFFLPSLLFFLGGLTAWLSFENFWPHHFSGYDMPWLFLGISFGVLFCPFDILFLNARLWLISTTTRLILSGLYPVEFRDFFLGDIFCSLTYSISNVSMFLCIYAKHWDNCATCGSSESRILGFLNCLPSIWRFLQCFRRYADTGDWFPHLANMLKYSVSTIYYVSLSLYRIDTINKYRILLIFWAIIYSVYSIIWDILMDWSLFQFDSKNFLLRDELIYKEPLVYYIAMILNVILRFQWVFYVLFPKQIQQSAITSFLVAIAEILRRFIWIFFRMENEHATNVHLFRASRESPLPYPINKKKIMLANDMHIINGADTSEDITDQGPKYLRKRTDIENTRADHKNVGIDEDERNSTSQNNVEDENDGNEQFQNTNVGNYNSNNPLTSSFARYFKQISRTLRNAHIKDFQRRKVVTPSVADADEENSDQTENDLDNNVAH